MRHFRNKIVTSSTYRLREKNVLLFSLFLVRPGLEANAALLAAMRGDVLSQKRIAIRAPPVDERKRGHAAQEHHRDDRKRACADKDKVPVRNLQQKQQDHRKTKEQNDPLFLPTLLIFPHYP